MLATIYFCRRGNKASGLLYALFFFVKTVGILLITILSQLGLMNSALATNGTSVDSCPVSYELSRQDRDALRAFELRLRQANGSMGQPRFERRLQQILLNTNPSQRLIDVSPFFMELALYQIDFKYLENSIARTLGLEHSSWQVFSREATYVLHYQRGGDEAVSRRFAQASENLLSALGRVRTLSSSILNPSLEVSEQLELEKARAAAQVSNMYLTVETVRFILNEVDRQRSEAFRAGLTFNTLRIASAAVVIAATIYAGPIIGAAGVLARGFVMADTVVAANLARVGQTLAGGALGVVGAPAGRLAMDSHAALGRARTLSRNNRTTYACELNRQMEIWQEQGVSPYLNVALMGGSIGLVGTGSIYVLPRVASQVLLSLSTFGVGVTTAYAVGHVGYQTALSLHEYNLAVEALERGDEDLAREHLHRSRDYAQAANERGIQGVLLGVLSASVGGGFREALQLGKESIAVIIANSADTMPLAIRVGAELATNLAQQSSQ